MARSNNVLAVVGMLCVNQKFRTDFFADPETAAQALVGTLTDNELVQVRRLGRMHVSDTERPAQTDALKTAFGSLYTSMNCNNSTCPQPPCPCPDNEDAALAVVL